jgi:hypothetical protein
MVLLMGEDYRLAEEQHLAREWLIHVAQLKPPPMMLRLMRRCFVRPLHWH